MGANWIERVGSRLRRFRMKHARGSVISLWNADSMKVTAHEIFGIAIFYDWMRCGSQTTADRTHRVPARSSPAVIVETNGCGCQIRTNVMALVANATLQVIRTTPREVCISSRVGFKLKNKSPSVIAFSKIVAAAAERINRVAIGSSKNMAIKSN